MKNVLVMGASGFIGREIIKVLKQGKIYNIMALEHKTPVEALGIVIIRQKMDKLNLNKLPFPPDVIIDAARMRTGRFGRIGRRIVAERGRIANRRFLKQIDNMKNSPRLIYLSGSLMYGSIPNSPIYENFPLSPISFAREYVCAEKPFLKEIEKGSTNLLMLRLPWVIGRGSWFVWNYLDFIAKNNKVPLYGEGNNIMTFIDVRDVAKIIVKLCHTPQHGLLNLFNPQYFTQKKFAEMMGRILCKEIQRVDIGENSKINPAVKEAFMSDIQLSSNNRKLQIILQQDLYAVEKSVAYFGSFFRENE